MSKRKETQEEVVVKEDIFNLPTSVLFKHLLEMKVAKNETRLSELRKKARKGNMWPPGSENHFLAESNIEQTDRAIGNQKERLVDMQITLDELAPALDALPNEVYSNHFAQFSQPELICLKNILSGKSNFEDPRLVARVENMREQINRLIDYKRMLHPS